MFKAFPYAKLDHIRCLNEAALVVAFGFRTCVVMNDNLDILCKFLDANKEEKYHCGEFYKDISKCFSTGNKYFLVMGGAVGVIKILDLAEGILVGYLCGHTGAIRDIKVFNNYVVSSSEDSSVRLWSLKSLECIGVCGGLFGHRDTVLSIDVLFDSNMIVSSGIDCTIKQWKIGSHVDKYLHGDPFTTFNNLHHCSITKVKYYGNMIVSLSNNLISMIFNNREMESVGFNLSMNDLFYIGSLHCFNNCKTFDIVGHILVGMGSNGDMYMFDLRDLFQECQPFLTSTGISAVEDFAEMCGRIYISSGTGIHRINLDLEYFMDS